MSALRQLGQTQQKLLRALLASPQGASVEMLCQSLNVTHNAVRQHLSALIAAGYVERGTARPTGGRPQARYLLLPAGRELFPRNYGLIASSILEHLYASAGKAGAQALLASTGQALGREAASRIEGESDAEIATRLAEQLDALGYEAATVKRDGETQVEAYNCVFHALARAHPDVCRFDLAFMEAATGRPIQHMECLLRGGHACRFRIGKPRTTGS
ncbi:helix-turn-helix transcriptional regulator [Rhodanobacter aciditrophus]|uniref:helix-turn-helix transcriptional regulator n=1 Tax=Rhodanobacter aciditrophus TaxID=1623218 RepID=UPI003CE7E870